MEGLFGKDDHGGIFNYGCYWRVIFVRNAMDGYFIKGRSLRFILTKLPMEGQFCKVDHGGLFKLRRY